MPSAGERAVRVYRCLLRLFPRRFRDRWGDEMESVFRHRLEVAGPGQVVRLRTWCRIVMDSLAGAAYEWIRLLLVDLQGRRHGSALWGQSLRHALKSLRRTPGPTLLALVTLALGTGATTTTFSVVDGVMLEDLPYPEPDRIVAVWPSANFNIALVREFEAQAPALEAVAGISTWTAVLSEGGAPVEVEVGVVSPSYFQILGVDAAMGRGLLPDEGFVDRPAVVVLSHGLWNSRFGRDPDIIGRTVQLSVGEREAYSVVGVMPQSFQPLHDVVAWVPLLDDPTLAVADDRSWYVNSRIARVASGASIALASAQVAQIATRLAPDVPNQFGEEQLSSAFVVPLKDAMISESRRALWVLLGAVGLVLLIACANVANLLLARGEGRRHHLAVRSALGADRGQIVRLLLSEALVLSTVGGLLGLSAAFVLTDVVIAFAPPGIPRIDQVSVDLTVLAFAMAVTVLTTLLSGLWPALRTSRTAPAAELGRSTRGSAGRRSSRFVSQGLVAAEIALAVIVALGSGLMLKSLSQMVSAETGFQPEGVLTLRANPIGSGRSGAEDFRQFYEQVLEQVRATPGVTAAGAVQILTGTPNNWSFPTYPEDYEIPESGAMPDVNFRAVTPDYFETLEIPLLQGRTIVSADREGAEPVVVVNKAFVERFWPGENAIGKTLSILSTDGTPYRVVGVVGDIRQHALYLEPQAELYVPYSAWPWEMAAWVLVRTEMPELFRAEARRIVDAVDPRVPVSGLDDLDVVIGRSALETRFLALLLTAFGALGLLLGAIGVYGVTAHTVARRRAEFGVRFALGAKREHILTSALAAGLTPVLLGLGLGAALGLGGGRLLKSYLYEVEPNDPATLALVVLTLTLVAASALAVPAWQASSISPTEALAGD